MAQNREERRQQFKRAYGAHEVEVIPADEKYQIDIHDRHEMVGAYSRVSTMSGMQVESFETQKLYYTKFIEQHPNWTMVDMYADEGISATSTKKRLGFQRLIQDCKAGKVSLIVTKTVTRFARNLVDCVDTCRQLKQLNPPVGVLFEADGIYTLDGQGEMHLALMAVVAQSDSETKSTSIKWAFRNRCAAGIPYFVKVYGYDVKKKVDLQPGEQRVLTINPEQAAVVRMIYDMFLAGEPISYIIRKLKQQNIPSPLGKEQWSAATITYILTNETYAGYIIRQKTYVADVFSHKSVKNDSKLLAKYVIRNTHKGIIPAEKWLEVQSKVYSKTWFDYLDLSVPIAHHDKQLYFISSTPSIKEGQ